MTGSTSQQARGVNRGSGIELPAGIMLGHYRLLRKIGQGGFGITYLAEHTQSHEQVVIKENLPTFYAYRDKDTLQIYALNDDSSAANYAHTLQRFVEEARTLARLKHPNIVSVHEAFEALGTAYYVMPYIEAKELHKAAPAKPNEAWLLPILKSVLGALNYLHEQNLLHRDLKPGNILVQEDGTPILIDFGTARALQTEHSATMVGTPGYTPLEQITPHGKRGPWTDIYALGATCYRVITGECPPQAVDRIEDEDPYRALASRTELQAHFSPALLRSIDKALTVRAKTRWQTAQEWLEILNRLAPKPTLKPIPAVTKTIDSRWEDNEESYTDTTNKGRPFIFVTLLLLLVAVIYGFCSYNQHTEENEQHEKFTPAEENENELLSMTEAQKILNSLGITDYNAEILNAYNDLEKLKLLISAGVDVNVADKDGWTALHYATYYGRTECVELLLEVPDIDVNKADKHGSTSLHEVAYLGNTNCLTLLLESTDINVNTTDKNGATPLHIIAEKGHTECVKLLLKAPDIEVNKKDNHGKTPLKIAKKHGHTKCAELIRAAGGTE